MTDIDLSAPEVQDAIDSKIAEAVKGLKDKNTELLGEIRKLKAGKTVDPADVEKLENEIDTLKGQLSEANKVAKKALGDAEKAAKALADADGFTQKLLVDNGLGEALAKAGVTNPVHIKAAKAMLAGQVQVITEGDQKVARFGDKPLADAITEWAGSDEGKHFVTAADISGGGSQGGRNNTTNPQPKGDSGGDKAAMVARATELMKQFEE